MSITSYIVKDFEITSSAVDRPVGQDWINDKTIEAYLNCYSDLGSVYIMDSVTALKIFSEGNSDYLKKIELEKYVSIIAAINVNKNHWCLVYISVVSKSFTFIDPLGEKKRMVNLMFKNWIKYTESNLILKDYNWSILNLNHKIQDDKRAEIHSVLALNSDSYDTFCTLCGIRYFVYNCKDYKNCHECKRTFHHSHSSKCLLCNSDL
ncbi:unnamed protein product [Brachionus calyciflorus]|uniref:Ubiquitin-like protease family profile domain-containing protein n=1 Tax=Brachionus calyciflorus TaxID=104777 RepID=A0A814J6J6_9BILA|nr:unnamed protein product [Brachionus calyciflorus]